MSYQTLSHFGSSQVVAPRLRRPTRRIKTRTAEKACPEEGEQAMRCSECGCDRLLIQLYPEETTGECLECGVLLIREEGGTLSPAPTS